MEHIPKQKVLFLITKSNWGGAQRYVFDLATNLSTEQYEIVVALGGNGPLATKLLTAGVRVITIPGLQRDVSLTQELRASRSIANIIRNERPDVLHLNSSKAGAVGALIGRVLRVPRVLFTAHAWAFNEDRVWLSRQLIKMIHWLTVLWSHHTITASDGLKHELNWPFVQHKMTTIYHGRAPIQFLARAEARDTLCRHLPSLPVNTTDIWTMSIGELHPIKQHDIAIAAIKQLTSAFPTLRHIVIGEGEQRNELQALIDRYALHNHVFLAGHRDEAAQYLKAADVFIFPSRSESLGYVALEAAQAGIPTVASAVGGIPEVVLDGVTGTLVPSGSADELATAVERYLTQPDLAAMHRHAAQQFGETFSIERMVTQTGELYR
jgi:glycosyltransferase involved in cell wall biosynthesis